jgi:hypothetical protein
MFAIGIIVREAGWKGQSAAGRGAAPRRGRSLRG